MHSIERYGIVALLFLVVTVVAVLMWDGGKHKKNREVAASAAVPVRVPEAPPERPAEEAREEARARRLSLVAEGQPGPLLRTPRAETALTPEAEDLPQALSAGPEAGTEALGASEEPGAGSALEAPVEKPALREEPAREPVVGAAAPATHAYSVRAGDTLSEIALRELGSSRRWPEIAAANPGLDPAKLRVGKPIQIPGAKAASSGQKSASSTRSDAAKSEAKASSPPKTWKVGKGENLWRIAERALGDGKRWREIAAVNPKVNPDKLVLGQVLVLPAQRGGARGSSAKPTATKVASAPKKKGASPTLVAGNTSSNTGSERGSRRGGRVVK